MSSITIDGYTIHDVPMKILAFQDMTVHLLDRLMAESKDRVPVSFPQEIEGRRVAHTILLRKDSSVAIHIDDDGSHVASAYLERAGGEFGALATILKAKVASTEG